MADLDELFHRREELPDGGHYDIIDTPEEPAAVVTKNVSMLFDRMAMFKTGNVEPVVQKVPRDWMWADVPEEISKRLATWRDMFVKALPGSEAVKDLHITLFHELLNFAHDLKDIITTAANAVPAEATLGGLRAFRTENDGIAVAIEVISFQLRDLRKQFQGFVQHTPSIHGTYTPHITLAYIPNCEGIAVEGLELFGIYGQKFLIESINAGTYDSNHPCAMLGARSEWISRFEPTTLKSQGMSTLTAESGGILINPWIDDDDDDDDYDDDDDDEQWIRRSQEMADNLDDLFGDL